MTSCIHSELSLIHIYARSDEDDLVLRMTLLEESGQLRHRRKIVGNLVREIRKSGLDVFYEGRTAGGCKKSFLYQLLRFLGCYHVCAQRHFEHFCKAQFFDTGDNLSQIGVQELAGNGRRHDGYRRIVSVYPALLQRVDHVYDAGYVYSCLLYTSTSR